MSAAVWDEPPVSKPPAPVKGCQECRRLRTHEYASAILRDWKWHGRTKAAQRKHRREQHAGVLA